MKFFIIVLMFMSMLGAKEIAVVEKFKGSVKLLKADSIKKIRVKQGQKIDIGDRLSTSSSASALIRLLDGSEIVLKGSSSIEFPSLIEVAQNSGSVYYKISKRDRSGALRVSTPFAIIGIKGTSFIVKSDGNASIALEEGRIGIESVGEAYELYRQKIIAEYDRFLLEQSNAFEAYKQEQLKGSKLIVKSFDLEAGKQVSFNNKRVDEASLSQESKAEFDEFKSLFNE
ncbi:MAG: FecR family protein [Campylobacterota bacterium]|nr:FecR family protein [Campylobacterota bacterium]